MENTLVNQNFEVSIQNMRGILPKLSFGLLIGTYIVSALIMAIFHSLKAPNFWFGLAAVLIAFAIQAGRGTLAFFFQLNPLRLLTKFSFGAVAATILLFLSLVEAFLVLKNYNVSWLVSVGTLMLIGWVIEIMLMRETLFATQLELFRNKEQWEELRSFYIARRELKLIIKGQSVQHQIIQPIARELPEVLPNEEEKKPEAKSDDENLLLGNV